MNRAVALTMEVAPGATMAAAGPTTSMACVGLMGATTGTGPGRRITGDVVPAGGGDWPICGMTQWPWPKAPPVPQGLGRAGRLPEEWEAVATVTGRTPMMDADLLSLGIIATPGPLTDAASLRPQARDGRVVTGPGCGVNALTGFTCRPVAVETVADCL